MKFKELIFREAPLLSSLSKITRRKKIHKRTGADVFLWMGDSNTSRSTSPAAPRAQASSPQGAICTVFGSNKPGHRVLLDRFLHGNKKKITFARSLTADDDFLWIK